MFDIGEIVIHENLRFNDNHYDQKENRTCIVLFCIKKDDRYLICTAPLTSSIHSFNKKPYKYCLIPEVIYNYKKLNFVNLENIGLHTEKDTQSTGIRVGNDEVKKIITRFKMYKPCTKKLKNMYDEIIEYIDFVEDLEKKEYKENAKELRKERKLKRKIAKRGFKA